MHRTIILTDCHVGNPESNYRELNRFLLKLECDRLILGGDFWDLWDMDDDAMRERHGDTIALLNRLVDMGVSVDLVLGNHDEDYADKPLIRRDRVAVLKKTEILTSVGRRIAVTHGHTFDPIFGKPNCLSKSLAWLNGMSRRILRLSYKTIKRKTCTDLSGVEYNSMVKNIHDDAMRSHMERGYDGLVMGHSHSPCHIKTDKFEFANAGDWKYHNTYVTVEDDSIELKST